MSETEMYCIGCGAKIQTDDPEKIGYTPASALAKADTEELYCQRCFRLRHYNEVPDLSLSDDAFLHFLNELGKADALFVNVVDIFDFDGSLIPGLHRFIGENPLILVGNKVDLLPKSVKYGHLIQWMKEEAHQAGLRPVDVLLTSGKKGFEIDELLAKIEKYRHGKDVYVVGVTNVGKSTLINQIIKSTSGIKDLITTSQFPGTTLDKIEIPLEDGHFLIDTPGVVHREQMAHFLGKKDLRIIAPNKEIKPKVYQLNPQQTIFLGGLARFDYLSGEKSPVIAYVSNDLTLHRTKLSNAADFYARHLGGLLTPPQADEVADFPELVRFEFSIEEKSDIVFAGLGWITVKGPSRIVGWAPKGVKVLKRKALI